MPVADIVCGDNFVVTKMAPTVRNVRTGIELYAWGNNSHGQCGIGKGKIAESTKDKENFVAIPTRVRLPALVSEVSGTLAEKAVLCYTEQDMAKAVLSAGSKHVLLALKGDIWAWGCNTNGQVGDGTFLDCHAPRRVWRHVAGALGFQNVVATTNDSSATQTANKRANQVIIVKYSGQADSNGDVRRSQPNDQRHHVIEGPYVKSVRAGTSTSVCITYSSRNIIATASSIAANASHHVKTPGDQGKDKVLRREARGEVSSRIFKVGAVVPRIPMCPCWGTALIIVWEPCPA